MRKIQNYLILREKAAHTPSKRHVRFLKRSFSLRKNIYLKSKVSFFKKRLGRSSNGQLVSFYHGGGFKKLYRKIENIRYSMIHQGIIEQIEYNPNHPILLVRIFNPLLNYHFYIRSVENFKIGLYIKTNVKHSTIGDCAKLLYLFTGKAIHNINLNNTNNIARAAGVFATILQKYKNYCLMRFPSQKLYYVPTESQATYGRLSNSQHQLSNLGKAGRRRWLGIRPHVRGVAMNPIDHPHGGGQGKTSGGHSTSVSAWGKPTKQIKKKKKKN